MKRLLQLSLVLNVILLVLLWRRSNNSSPWPEGPLDTTPSPKAVSLARPTRAEPQAATQSKTAWEGLESKNLAEFIERLRAAGCPEQTIREIVVFRVARDYRNRLLALEAEQQRASGITKPRIWRDARASQKQQRVLRDEMNSTLEALLGQPWHTLASDITGFPSGNNFLDGFPIATRQRLRELESRLQELRSDLEMKRITGRLNAKEVELVAGLDRQRQAELSQVLNPQELKEYLYRNSEAASYVRQHLPAAKSEAEFRAMVEVALQFGMTNLRDRDFAQYDATGTGVDDALRERDQRKAAFDAELKRVLGEQRVEEQQAEASALAEASKQREDQRREEQQLAEFSSKAASVGVNLDEAKRFMDRMKELQPVLGAKFTELEKSLTGTPQERGKKMKAIVQAELERVAVETIGDKGRALVKKLVEENH